MPPQQLGRAKCQVRLGRNLRQGLGEDDLRIVARSNGQHVAEIDQRENRFEPVIAVVAPPGHMQEQIELRRRGHRKCLHRLLRDPL